MADYGVWSETKHFGPWLSIVRSGCSSEFALLRAHILELMSGDQALGKCGRTHKSQGIPVPDYVDPLLRTQMMNEKLCWNKNHREYPEKKTSSSFKGWPAVLRNPPTTRAVSHERTDKMGPAALQNMPADRTEVTLRSQTGAYSAVIPTPTHTFLRGAFVVTMSLDVWFCARWKV